jgi:hypothetical protein
MVTYFSNTKPLEKQFFISNYSYSNKMERHLWDFGDTFVFFDGKDWDSPTEDDYETHDIYESWDDFYNRKPPIISPIIRWQWIRRCGDEYSSWEHVFNPEFIKKQRHALEHYYISDIAKLITDYFGYTEPDLRLLPFRRCTNYYQLFRRRVGWRWNFNSFVFRY